MNLSGTILIITHKFVRILTTDKQQELDVFYTESTAPDIRHLICGEQVIFDTKIQSVNVNTELLGRFWLWYVISPARTFEKKYKDKNTDWSKRHQKNEVSSS